MVTFTKMHGLGNDYICINCLENILAETKLPHIARYMCNRNFGIGADGLILVQESTIADIKMRIFNKDGSEAVSDTHLMCIRDSGISNNNSRNCL